MHHLKSLLRCVHIRNYMTNLTGNTFRCSYLVSCIGVDMHSGMSVQASIALMLMYMPRHYLFLQWLCHGSQIAIYSSGCFDVYEFVQ